MGAVALVVLAVVVRRSIDDDGSGGSDGGDAGDGRLVLVCAADLAAACDAVAGVTVIRQDAAVTAAAIVDGDLPDGADGWVTTTAWTEVVEARSPGRIDEQEVLARSPVVVAVDPRRTTAVEGHCPEALWRCLGDDAGSDWGSIGGDPAWGALKVGLPGADSATGLSVLASVASGYFGATDFASNDFDTSDFASWLGTLTEPSGKGEATPVRTLVTTRGKYTAVGDVAAAVGDLSADVLTPAPCHRCHRRARRPAGRRRCAHCPLPPRRARGLGMGRHRDATGHHPQARRDGRALHPLDGGHPMTRTLHRTFAALVALGLLAAACTAKEGAIDDGNVDDDPGDCIVVDLSVSPEKVDLLTELAQDFNGSDEATGRRPVRLRPRAEQALRRRGAAARRRVGRGRRGPAPGHLVARGVEPGGRSLNQRLERPGSAAPWPPTSRRSCSPRS